MDPKFFRKYADLITEAEQDADVLTSFMTNLKGLLGKSRTSHWDNRPTGHPAFFGVRRRQFLQLKMSDNTVSFALPWSANVSRTPSWEPSEVEDAFNKANTSGATLYVAYEYGRVPTDRQGRIAGPMPVMFTVSTQKLPNTKFVIGGDISSEVLQQVRAAVPKTSSNDYAYLKDIRSEGDRIVISYAYRMAGMRDRDARSGAPSDAYDEKIIAGTNEYRAIAQELSQRLGIRVEPKEVAW